LPYGQATIRVAAAATRSVMTGAGAWSSMVCLLG
jgi:hypothetical protein